MVPLALELLLEGGWQLRHLDLFRGENTQEEGPFFFFFVAAVFRVWYDDVVHVFLVVDWRKRHCFGDFALSKPLQALGCLQDHIVLVNLPKSFSLGLDSDDQEVDRDVGTL